MIKPKFTPEIGEKININRRNHFHITAICVEDTERDCNVCVLDSFPNICKRCNCGVDVRADGKSIIFKEVDNDNKG